MFGAFHKKGSVPRLYMKQKDCGRGLISVFDCVKQEELAFSEYVKETEEWMLKVVGETLHVGETKNEYKKRVEKTRMECFLGKRLHGKFMRDVTKVADARSWQWLRAGYLGKGTEGYVFAAQEQELQTRFFRTTNEREDVDPKCRVCCKEVARFSCEMAYLPSRKNLANESLRNCEVRQVLCILTIFCRFKPKNVCILPKFSSFQLFQSKIILVKCCKEVIVPPE